MIMYYDILYEMSSREDRKKIAELEIAIDKILSNISEIISEKYPHYVDSFGLTGSMAHGEATAFFCGDEISGSDCDLAIVTKIRSMRMQKKLESVIRKAFRGSGIEPGALFFSPSIYRKPDLMFCEYADTGKVLYGRKIELDYEIPIWEAAKILVSRSGAFLDSISFDNGIKFKENFPYSFSKAIFGISEASLIIDGNYGFTISKRRRLLKNSKTARKISGFFKLYETAYNARYGKAIKPDALLVRDTARALHDVFLLTSQELSSRSGREVEKLRAPFPTSLSTRYSYFRKTVPSIASIRILREPFVEEYRKMEIVFEKMASGKIPNEKERKSIAKNWKSAGDFRFWLPY